MNREKKINIGIDLADRYLSIAIKKYNLIHYMSKEDIEDMRQDCVVQVIEAVNRYRGGVKLTTFLVPRICGFYIDYIRKRSSNRRHENMYYYQQTAIFKDQDFTSKFLPIVLMTDEQAMEYLDGLDINDDIYNIIGNLPHSNEFISIMSTFSSIKVYVILNHFILNKSIKKISSELGFSYSGGRAYKIKREVVDQVKKMMLIKTKIGDSNV